MKNKRVFIILLWLILTLGIVGLAGCGTDESKGKAAPAGADAADAAESNGEWVLEAVKFPKSDGTATVIDAADGSIRVQVYDTIVIQYDYTVPPQKLKPGDTVDCTYSLFFVETKKDGRNEVFDVRHDVYVKQQGEHGRISRAEMSCAAVDEKGNWLNWIYHYIPNEDEKENYTNFPKDTYTTTNTVTFRVPPPKEYITNNMLEFMHTLSLSQGSIIVYEYVWKDI